MFKCPKCHKESKDPYTIYYQPALNRPIKLNGNDLGIVGPAVKVRCGQCGNEELMLFDPDVAEKFRQEAGITTVHDPVRGVCPNCRHDIIWNVSIDGMTRRCPNCHYIDGEEVFIPKTTITFSCPKCHTEHELPNYSTKFMCGCGFECELTPLDQVSPVERFSSGAVRGKDNTPTYTLIPACALRRLAKIYETGNIRYPDNQWRKGIPVSNIVDHALEHLMKWLEGSRTEDHLAKVAWAMFSLMYYESVDKLEDDVKWAASSKH